MPYARYQDRLAASRRYAQTPEGKAAKARSHARYVEKRRAMNRKEQPFDAQAMARVLEYWK